MASCLTLIIAGLYMIGRASGQSAKQVWTAEEFYSPQTDALQCGFPNNVPAYICDPNGILGKHLPGVNWILEEAAHNTTCPCSAYYCETYPKPRGYKIGVALVKKMKIERNSQGELMSAVDQAQKFTYTLKTSKYMLGDCEEDIIVFYSVADKMLSILAGRTANMKLTPYYRDLLAYKVGQRLNEGKIVDALHVLLHDMKIVLRCDAEKTYDCNLYDTKPSSASSCYASFSFTVLAAMLISLFYH